MYDARSKIPGGNESIVFGVIGLLVVCLAFAGAWFATGMFGSDNGGPRALAAAPVDYAPSERVAAIMANGDEKRLLNAAAQLDMGAVSRFEAAFEASANREEQIEEVGILVADVTVSNFEHLAHVSVDDLNTIIDTGLRQVGALQRTGSPLCNGRTLAAFEGMDEARARAALASMGVTPETAYTTSLSYQADFLEMIVRAKRSPVRHGKVTSRDERIIQDVTMGIFMDPVLMKAASASSPSEIAEVDVCEAGVRLLQVAKDIPDETKGRAWAALFGMPELQDAMGQLSGFVSAGS